MATSFAAYPFRVRLNGASVAMAGVTAVATLPEFRRAGLLRQVMTKALREQREERQRRYADEGLLKVSVLDPLCEWNNGTYAIDTDRTDTAVVRTSGEGELTMPVASLAVLLSGNRGATTLANAGLLWVADEKALRTADRIFATRYAPWCPDGF